MTHWNTEAAPPARQAAYEGLYEIFEKSAYANLTLQHFFGTGPGSRRNGGF